MVSQKCTGITIVLPWVHIATTPEYIINIFNELNWGTIDSTEFIERKQTTNTRTGNINPSHYKVFVKLTDVTKEGNDVNSQISFGKDVKVNHSRGFWKVDRRNPIYTKLEDKTNAKTNTKAMANARDTNHNGFKSLFVE